MTRLDKLDERAPGAAPDAATLAAAMRAALADAERPNPPGPLSTSLTFGWRALLKIKHVPEQLFDVTAFPVMFTLLFTFLFGGAIAGSVGGYLQYVLPGLLVQGVIMITMYTGSTLRTDIDRGVFDRFRSLPIWRPSALVGMLLGDAVRYTISAAVTISLGLALGYRPEGGVAGVLMAVLLILVFAFSFSWLWTFFALVLRTPGAVMGVSMLVITPLTFASNIFIEPSTLPTWLQAFVEVNPVSHLVTAVRDFMGGMDASGELSITLLWCAGLVAVFGPLTMIRYRTAG